MLCFQLLQDGNPVNLPKVDDELRACFNQPADSENYLWNWKVYVGLVIAAGKADSYILENPRHQAVMGYLKAKYDFRNWRS
jgi:hypothetical protein